MTTQPPSSHDAKGLMKEIADAVLHGIRGVAATRRNFENNVNIKKEKVCRFRSIYVILCQ